ncbi:Phosphoprotein phosphatase [Schizosaccharomyces pombe]
MKLSSLPSGLGLASLLGLISSAAAYSATDLTTMYDWNQIIKPLEWGQLNFIHTTDTHGWLGGHLRDARYKADFGEFKSFALRMKELADFKGVDLLMVDTGDLHDGNGLSDASDPQGIYTNNIFTYLPYDILTIGNHELYQAAISNNTHEYFVPHWNGTYLASNVQIYNSSNELEQFGGESTYFITKHGVRTLAMGFLFNFSSNANNTVVTPVETAIKSEWYQQQINRTDVDLFLLIGHIPVRDYDEWKSLHASIRKVHPNTPIQILGGHSHIRDFAVYDEASVSLEGGRYCETVGWLSIDGLSASNATRQYVGRPVTNETRQSYPNLPKPATPLYYTRRYIDFNRQNFRFHTQQSEDSFDTPEGVELSKVIKQYRDDLNLSYVFGCIPKNYYMTEVSPQAEDSIFKLMVDHILPEVLVNENRSSVPHIIISNGGGVRGSMYEGTFGPDEMFQLNPFLTNYYNYIPDVPYKYAKKLYSILNGGSTLRNVNDYLAALNPGYVTSDDFGEDGDDTVHTYVSTYAVPNVLQAQVGFNTTSAPETVDVVFLNYFQTKVLKALNTMVNETIYTLSNVAQYWVREDGKDSSPYMFAQYVQQEWSDYCD